MSKSQIIVDTSVIIKWLSLDNESYIDRANVILEDVQNQKIEVAVDTFSLASKLGITYYDASFLSLAKLYKATLVTENIKHQGKTKDIKVVALKDY